METALLDGLAAPLDPRRVHSREGSGGKKLSYLKTHDVKRTANRIFGYDGWSYVVEELVSLGSEPFVNSRGREGTRVGYRATVAVTIGDVRRGDVGYGDAMEYNESKITPHELASKEAVSDALKRCLSSWGDQFGLGLYGADPTSDTVEQPVERTFPTPQLGFQGGL
jgi:DNA repair and recombination protein RAD52